MGFKKVDGYETVLESTVEKGSFLYDLSTEQGREESDRHYAESVARAKAMAEVSKTLAIIEELLEKGG